MRYYDQGAFYEVTFSARDAAEFSYRWPCSTVRGRGSFTFNANNGDLVEVRSADPEADGPEWAAFAQDCQNYAKHRRNEGPEALGKAGAR